MDGLGVRRIAVRSLMTITGSQLTSPGNATTLLKINIKYIIYYYSILATLPYLGSEYFEIIGEYIPRLSLDLIFFNRFFTYKAARFISSSV